MLRHWVLTLLGLAMTLGLCAAAAYLVPPTYEARASILLLPPKSSLAAGGNPYLQLGGLGQAVDVLGRALSTKEVADAIAVIDARGTYAADPDESTSGPILLLAAEGTTAAQSLAILNELIARGPETLADLQSSLSVAPRSQITSMVLTRDQAPTAVQKTRIRVVALAGAGGLLLTAFGVALVDGAAQRRKKREAETRGTPSRRKRKRAKERSREPDDAPLQPKGHQQPDHSGQSASVSPPRQEEPPAKDEDPQSRDLDADVHAGQA